MKALVLYTHTHTHTHTHTDNLKNKRGITLVALIVTIIILLILAGVSIATLTESGLFEKAKQAEQKSENAKIKEETTLADYENKIGEYVNGSRDVITNEQYSSILARLDELEKYKAGEVNFGNAISAWSYATVHITLDKPLENTKYSVVITNSGEVDKWPFVEYGVRNKGIDGFDICAYNASNEQVASNLKANWILVNY